MITTHLLKSVAIFGKVSIKNKRKENMNKTQEVSGFHDTPPGAEERLYEWLESLDTQPTWDTHAYSEGVTIVRGTDGKTRIHLVGQGTQDYALMCAVDSIPAWAPPVTKDIARVFENYIMEKNEK